MRAWKWCTPALVLLVTACGGGSGNQDQLGRNAGSNPQTFTSQVLFDPVPLTGKSDDLIIPFPFDALFADFTKPTLNIPNNSGPDGLPNTADDNPLVTAANLTDGFSTVASAFFDIAGQVPFDSITANLLIVNGATGQVLKPGIDYTLQPSPALKLDKENHLTPISEQRTRVLIEPLVPLAPSTTYLLAFKTGAKTTDGQPVLAGSVFKIVRSATPVAQQTDPLLASYSDAQKGVLEKLRSQVIRPLVELSGIPEDQLALIWSITTQSTDKTLKLLAAGPTGAVGPGPGGSTTTVGAAGAAAQPIKVQDTTIPLRDLVTGAVVGKVFAGTVQLPYFLANSAGNIHNPAPLRTFWAADATKPSSGVFTPTARTPTPVPCADFGAGIPLPGGNAQPSDSTTACYPVPLTKSTEIVPLIATVPNGTPPTGGWPVVIFQHGITGNRTNMLAIAPALAQAGFVTVAIDLPLHGITSASDTQGNTGLFNFFSHNQGVAAAGLRTGERTFDLDLIHNATGAPGPDGLDSSSTPATIPDPSGTHFINLTNLAVSRDNLRQAASDLLNLSRSVGSLDFDGGGGDVNASRVSFVGHSLGGIVGGTFLGVDSTVGAATLAMSGGGIAKLLDASKAFGPRVAAGLAAAKVNEGTDDYESFLRFAQQLVDSGDPVNFTAGAKTHPLHVIEVVNDLVVPNTASVGPASATQDTVTITGFLSGTTPYIQTLGLNVVGPLTVPVSPASQTGSPIPGSPPLRIATVFAGGDHSSILKPASASDVDKAITGEMQRDVVNFLLTNGTCLPTGGNCTVSAP